MPTKRTRKLGKAQERRLHTALSIDDLLYQKFDYLNRQLHEAAERFLKRPRRVVRVLGLRGNVNDGIAYELQIVCADITPEGTFVMVRLPPESSRKTKQAKSRKAPAKVASSQDTIKPPPGFSLGAMKNYW